MKYGIYLYNGIILGQIFAASCKPINLELKENKLSNIQSNQKSKIHKKGNSKFDLLVQKYGIPKSLNEFVRMVEKESGPNALSLSSFPQGRSLTRIATTYDYSKKNNLNPHFYNTYKFPILSNDDFFRYPRWIFAVAREGKNVDLQKIQLKDQLYFGYQSQSNILEIISYNEIAERFEFQVIENLTQPGNIVKYANRRLCLTCHQNEAPIYASISKKNIWEESLENPIFYRDQNKPNSRKKNVRRWELVVKNAEKLGIRSYFPESDESFLFIAQNFQISQSIKRANIITFARKYWHEGCEKLSERSSCRKSLFFAAALSKVISFRKGEDFTRVYNHLQSSPAPTATSFLERLLKNANNKPFEAEWGTLTNPLIANRSPSIIPPFPLQTPESRISCGKKQQVRPMCPRNRTALNSASIVSIPTNFSEIQNRASVSGNERKNTFKVLDSMLTTVDALMIMALKSKPRLVKSGKNLLSVKLVAKIETFAKKINSRPNSFWTEKHSTYIRKNFLSEFTGVELVKPKRPVSREPYVEEEFFTPLNEIDSDFQNFGKYCGECHRGGSIDILGGKSSSVIKGVIDKYILLIRDRTDYANSPEGELMPPISSSQFRDLAQEVTLMKWADIVSACQDKGPKTSLYSCVEKLAKKCEHIYNHKIYKLEFGKCSKPNQ